MLPAEPLEVELGEFAVEPRRHLRASWLRGLTLVLTIDGESFVVDTLADLEAVHAVLERCDD